jgi:tight adherence protein C
VPSIPAVLARPLGEVHQRRAARSLERIVEHELPVTIDLLAVAVGAGCTPYLAVDVAATWSPPMLASELAGVVRACTLGRSFADALDDLAARVSPVRPLADALLASERFGAAVGDALIRLAAEQRAVLRRRAETRARTVPVRLLFPLVFLVLPAFGLLTVVPALLAGFSRS